VALWGTALLLATECFAQGPTDNPYRPVRGLADGGGPSVPGGEWARLPGGREMGPPASVHVDIDGESIWAFIRCDETSPVPVARGGRFGIDCMLPDGKLKPHDTIYKFDAKGNVVKSFGAQMFIWPHGLHIDREGNVWATDAAAEEAVATAAKAGVKAGHVVRKFSPDGQLLMTLGEPGVAGNDEGHFRSPAGVVTAPNGDIFIADGYGKSWVHRYDKNRKYVSSFGGPGSEPGQMNTPHGLALDTRTNPPTLLVADRANHRLQVFDLEGKFQKVIEGFRMPCSVDIQGEYVAVADLQGRVTILNGKNEVVTQLGDNPNEALRGNHDATKEQWQDGLFTAPHSARWDAEGNLYVMDWNVLGRINKLKRVK